MSMSNPFGLHTITPYLIVPNVVQLTEFLTELLSAEQRGDLVMREDGSVQHAELSIGDSVVMMGEPTEDFPAKPGTLYAYVDDCDARFARAIELGAKVIFEPKDFPHGDRYGGISDLSGNIWWLATHTGN